MACANLPNPDQNSGNSVYGIPVKIGAPMSTACQRIDHIGSIPSVLNYANFTLADGAPVATKPSNGGIVNMSNFFTRRSGCYGDVVNYGSNCG